jgi:uncharacterized protein YjbJ (UPF0337 family)
VNWDTVEDNWKQLTASAKENWAKLTDQELERISGKRELLITQVHELYGVTRREADKQVWDWAKSIGRRRKTIA